METCTNRTPNPIRLMSVGATNRGVLDLGEKLTGWTFDRGQVTEGRLLDRGRECPRTPVDNTRRKNHVRIV